MRWWNVVFLWVIGGVLLTGCATPEWSRDEASAADAQLAESVRARLTQDAVAGGLSLGVSAQGGTIRLRGQVPDETVRLRVLSVTRSAPGVRGVDDRLFLMRR